VPRKVKFCGNCNPEVHPGRVKAALEELLADGDDSDLVLVNGCSRACLTKGMENVKGTPTIMSARDVVERKR
jgi:hypothetical protein